MTGIDDMIKKAMKKKAVGYVSKEIIEEYKEEDGVLIMTKKKVTLKEVPPDAAASKIVMDGQSNQDLFANMTDEELEKEKIRLLQSLKEKEIENQKDT